LPIDSLRIAIDTNTQGSIDMDFKKSRNLLPRAVSVRPPVRGCVEDYIDSMFGQDLPD